MEMHGRAWCHGHQKEIDLFQFIWLGGYFIHAPSPLPLLSAL
jgi:hypothetical protein